MYWFANFTSIVYAVSRVCARHKHMPFYCLVNWGMHINSQFDDRYRLFVSSYSQGAEYWIKSDCLFVGLFHIGNWNS